MSVGYLLADFQDAWERYLPDTKELAKPATADMEADSGTEGDVRSLTSVTGSGADEDDDEIDG